MNFFSGGFCNPPSGAPGFVLVFCRPVTQVTFDFSNVERQEEEMGSPSFPVVAPRFDVLFWGMIGTWYPKHPLYNWLAISWMTNPKSLLMKHGIPTTIKTMPPLLT